MWSKSRGLLFGAALASMGACGGAASAPPAPPAPPPAEPEPSQPEHALASARRLAKAARELRRPSLAKRTRQDALAYLKGDVAAWLVLRRAASVEAEAEYLAAARRAPKERTTALLEAADMWLEFAEQFSLAMKDGTGAITGDYATLLDAVDEAVEPLLERAEKLVEQCAETNVACRQRLGAVKRRKPQRNAALAQEVDNGWRAMRVATPARKPLPTSSPRPCSYRGSLELDYGRAYLEREGLEPALSVTNVELDLLELPERRAGRFHIMVSWPIVAEAWLDAAALPLATRRRLPVKEPHLWLGSGARVFAWKGEKAATANIGRPLEENQLERAFEADMPCGDLSFPRALPEDPREGYVSGSLGLFAKKGGTEFARYELPISLPVHVLARDGDWLKVRGHVSDFTLNTAPYLPFDFEAWTDAMISDQSELGTMVGTFGPEVPPSHRAGADLKLFGRPGQDQRPLAKAAPGAPFRAGRTSDGYVAIRFEGVGGANENSEFWVEASALSQQASRW